MSAATRVLLPAVPPHLLALIQQKAIQQEEQQQQDDDENGLLAASSMIDFLPLPVEPIGYGFFHYSKEPKDTFHKSSADDDAAAASLSASDSANLSAVALALGENYYHILGFPTNVNPHTVTHLQIKKAYKKAALRWHPDKLPNKDDTMFKKVNRAWEVLGTSRTSKIRYDSSLPFDDSVPDYDENEDKGDEEYHKFFKKYQEAFDRWANLATCHKNMIVKLGNIHSTKKHVDNFYMFWTVSFKSWRDYGYMNEYDESNADSREERRWMQRQNSKKNLTHKKEEREKLKALIAACKKHDPRIKKFAREESEQREKIRLQKEQEALEKERARIQKMEEERLEKERQERERIEEKKRKQAEKQKQQSELQALQRQFRQMCQPYVPLGSSQKKDNTILAEEVEFVVARMKSIEELTNVITRFNALGQDNFVASFDKCLKALKKRDEDERKERQQQIDQLSAKQQQQQNEREWTQDELVMLTKAVVKFPGGTSERWKRVAEFVGTRTPDEVQKMTGDIKKGKINVGRVIGQKKKEIQATDNKEEVLPPKEWTKEEQKLFEDAIRKHKALKGDEKWQAVASELKDRSVQDCKDRFEFCKEMALKKKSTATKK